MMGLTPRQAELLAYLRSRSEPHGASFDEMRVALGLDSNSSVTRLLNGLEERGHVRRLRNRFRAVEVLKQPVLINGTVYRFIPKTRAA